MALYNQIDLSCERFILDNPRILDNVFYRDPLFVYLRDTLEEQFTGGRRKVESDFEYDAELGGAYDLGDEFDVTEKQAEDAFRLPMQFYYSNVTALLEDLEVFNVGARAVYKFLNTRMGRALKTLGAHIALSLYLNGSRAGYTRLITGLTEALNDGATAGWDGFKYATYGEQTRGGADIGDALSSVPYTTGSTTITIKDLEDSITRATVGEGEDAPNIGVVTFPGFSAIKSKFLAQQRFETVDPKTGFVSFNWNGASLMRSRYMPGTELGGALTNQATKVANAFMSKSSKGVVAQYPLATSENLVWLNARKKFIRFLVSKSKRFGFGFTGFKTSQTNNKVVGQMLASVCLIVRSPRHHVWVSGFTK